MRLENTLKSQSWAMVMIATPEARWCLNFCPFILVALGCCILKSLEAQSNTIRWRINAPFSSRSRCLAISGSQQAEAVAWGQDCQTCQLDNYVVLYMG